MDGKPDFSLKIAVVLYENEPGQVFRMLRSLDASVSQLKTVRKAKIKLGDCSKSPSLTATDVDKIQHQMRNLEIEYEFWDENIHHSLGINRLCNNSEEEALLVLNPDSILSSNTLSELFKKYDGRNLVEARQFPIEHTKPFDTKTGITSWSSGCCLLVPSNIFNSLNGFDGDVFPNYGNDVDFSWRAKIAGSDSLVAENAFVYHDKRFDPAIKRVAVSGLEGFESQVSYLLMLRKFACDAEYSKTIEWLTKNSNDFNSITKLVSLRLTKIKFIDNELTESSFFSIRDGVYGPSNLYELGMSNRDFKFRYSRKNHKERILN